MNITEFLSLIKEKPQLDGYTVINLHGKNYPLLFFSQLWKRIKDLHDPAQPNASFTIDATASTLPQLKMQLSMSFLGQSSLYWVKNIHELDSASHKAWLSFVKEYQGPHVLFFFDEDPVKSVNTGYVSIELPEKINKQTYSALFSFMYPQVTMDSTVIRALFDVQESLALDEACLLMSYHTVMGKNAEAFFKHWFAKLVIPQKSLFLLSQYFFARQPKLFLQQWKACKSDYPDEFWTAYWSEQLWQATLFVDRVQSQGYELAKKGSYRLPFSFINKDWNKHTVESLAQTHQFLYTFDHNLKNGASSVGLELMFHHNWV